MCGYDIVSYGKLVKPSILTINAKKPMRSRTPNGMKRGINLNFPKWLVISGSAKRDCLLPPG